MPQKDNFLKGIIRENPVYVLALGLCPTLAVTTSVKNGIGMGIAATFVLVMSNLLVSLMRKFIPAKVRIPAFIMVIASFVTIVELVMKAYFPALNQALGIFIPLIVVNCIILGRAEAYAYRNNITSSLVDGLGMGVGFTFALLIIGGIREALGSNKLFGLKLIPGFEPITIMILAPGGFLVLGLILAFLNQQRMHKEQKAHQKG